ncbi:hypothetical protein G5I_07233 [Acromyrmex echinatior]|uniref:Uncharacterized protein n=1 Tax=Acromyrmex echinatior TaxID=103372 RepID=F4WN83_ACREC|nr:hypothetical protein G5I_07233 [Acromyrmex echinatior]
MFAPVSPRHGESRKCIETAEEGERAAKNSTESRNEKERRRKKENEEGISRKEIREMMSPSASTPSAAFRTKRVAKNLPPLVHDDDRERRLRG